MFVYIWKDPTGVPFYVGLTKSTRRTNPVNGGNRNWLCRKKLAEVGFHNVIIELRPVVSIVAGQELERKLIAEYGRIQTETGPLTNLSSGGDGVGFRSPETRAKMSAVMKNPNHPAHSPEARAKQRARMQDPTVKALFTGDANPAKKLEVRAKIKAKWEDPDFRAARIAERVGVKKHSDQFKDAARQRLLNPDNLMREYHKVLNSDPTIAAKRAATLRSPEQRSRQSEAMKAYWAKRKSLLG